MIESFFDIKTSQLSGCFRSGCFLSSRWVLLRYLWCTFCHIIIQFERSLFRHIHAFHSPISTCAWLSVTACFDLRYSKIRNLILRLNITIHKPPLLFKKKKHFGACMHVYFQIKPIWFAIRSEHLSKIRITFSLMMEKVHASLLHCACACTAAKCTN